MRVKNRKTQKVGSFFFRKKTKKFDPSKLKLLDTDQSVESWQAETKKKTKTMNKVANIGNIHIKKLEHDFYCINSITQSIKLRINNIKDKRSPHYKLLDKAYNYLVTDIPSAIIDALQQFDFSNPSISLSIVNTRLSNPIKNLTKLQKSYSTSQLCKYKLDIIVKSIVKNTIILINHVYKHYGSLARTNTFDFNNNGLTFVSYILENWTSTSDAGKLFKTQLDEYKQLFEYIRDSSNNINSMMAQNRLTQKQKLNKINNYFRQYKTEYKVQNNDLNRRFKELLGDSTSGKKMKQKHKRKKTNKKKSFKR